MCGIAGVFLRDPDMQINLDRVLDFMLDEIDHRGGDATGYAAFGDDGVLEWQKAACAAKDFMKYRRRVPAGTRGLIAHTRWATQGLPAFMENNHPIRRGAFFVIHNGHVSNDIELFAQCGKKRYGQVDSEAIAAALSTRGTLNAVGEVMEDIDGMAAIAAVDERCGDRLTLARGYFSPLFVLETSKIVMFGSTQRAVLETYRACIGTISEKRVTEVPEGTVIHYEGRERREETFHVQRPPVVIKRPTSFTPTGWAWQDDMPDFDDGSEDFLACDECQTYGSWRDMRYLNDPDLGGTVTICLCRECYEDEMLRAWAAVEEDDAAPDPTDDFSFVNQAVLDAAKCSTDLVPLDDDGIRRS